MIRMLTVFSVLSMHLVSIQVNAQQRIPHQELKFREGLAYHLEAPFTGISFSVWENDSLRFERTWTEGKLNGPLVECYNTGILAKRSSYQMNDLTGELLEYYPSGTLSKRAVYKKGVLDGLFEDYYPSGSLKVRGKMKNGLWNGPFEEYFGNGQLKIKSTRVNNGWDGAYEEYLENGVLYLKGRYRNGTFKSRRG